MYEEWVIMYISDISIYILQLPLTNPFQTGFGRVDSKRTVLIKMRTNSGLIGFGEAAAFEAPLYNHETIDTCVYIIEKILAPVLLDNKICEIEDLNKLFRKFKGHNIAKCSLEMALWDIKSQEANLSLAQKLGGIKDKIGVGESIGLKTSIKATLEEVDERLDSGFQRIKLKITPGWDIQIVDAVRNHFGNIPLMVDANSSYSLKEFPVLKQLDEYDLMMIEQPLNSDDLWDHAKIQRKLNTPICLDESIKSIEHARKAIEMGSCKVINIKPSRVGGILEAKIIHDLCQENDVPVWCGGMLETGIGRAFCIALSSLPNFRLPGDISPSNFFYEADVLADSYQVDSEGFIKVSTNKGLGYEIETDMIERYKVSQIDLTTKL